MWRIPTFSVTLMNCWFRQRTLLGQSSGFRSISLGELFPRLFDHPWQQQRADQDVTQPFNVLVKSILKCGQMLKM